MPYPQELAIRLLLACLISVFLTSCGIAKIAIDQSNFDAWEERTDSIEFGASSKTIKDLLGAPQKQFWHPEKGIRVLYYCQYGITKGVEHVYWISDDFGYYAEGVQFNQREALYWDGKPGLDCYSKVKVDWKYSPPLPKHHFGWTQEIYNIDRLQIITESKDTSDLCSTGTIHKIVLTGEIGPDSSFAIGRLLERLRPCVSKSGTFLIPITVSLRSGGGLLEDGYELGQTLRKYAATSIIEDGYVCASSCAVAFLGGKKRIVEDDGAILFHAPYYKDQNKYSSERVDCDVGDASLNKLQDYYQTITDEGTGNRLFERTMTYCSAEDGWLVTGGAAAQLFGIATDR